MSHAGFTRYLEYPGVLTQARYHNGVKTTESSFLARKILTGDVAAPTTKNLRRSDGTRPPSNWVRQGGVVHGVMGQYSRFYTIAPDHYEDRWSGLLASPGVSPGNIPYINSQGELEAIRSALGRFSEAEVQLGAALRQARQTADMVGKYYRHANTLAGKLVDAANGSKRVRQQFRDFARNGWRDVPSAYLEYLFGMKPLADDLANAVQVLHDTKQHDGAFNMSLRGRWKGEDSEVIPAYSSNVNYVDVVKGTVFRSQLSRACLAFQLPDWYWDRLPPVTFFRESWENTPLSFVLDWVLPVNSWLAGFEGNQLRPFFREGSRSTLMRREVSGNIVDDPYWIGESDGGREYAYRRTAFFEFPTGELFSLPRFRNILGLDQLRVGSALLGQRLATLQRVVHRI